MFPLMRKYLGGSLKAREFCTSHKLNYATFWYWLKKYRKQENPGVFQQIDLGDSGTNVKFELELKGGLQIRFYEYPSHDYLVALVDRL